MIARKLKFRINKQKVFINKQRKREIIIFLMNVTFGKHICSSQPFAITPNLQYYEDS